MNRSISMAILTFAALIASGAQAKFVAVLEEVGSNVVEVGSGGFDLTDLGAPSFAETITAAIDPDAAGISTSSNNPNDANFFFGAIVSPSNFGPGSESFAPFSVGDPILVSPTEIAVPVDYIFGAPLANSSIYPNATFSSLGVTPGAYVWSWGIGAHADTFTLQIIPSSSVPAAPEASTWAMTLIGFAGLGYAALQRKGGVRSV
jgi:hypothetical protein